MRSWSDRVWLMVPGFLGILLIALFAAPMTAGSMSLMPNVAWVMTLVIASVYPPAWGRGFAFVLGMLQDVVFGTPLGAQALLTLLLAQFVAMQIPRQAMQSFPVRWFEAAATLVLWHVFLWAAQHFVSAQGPSLVSMVRMGVVNALWYPLFYFLLSRITLLLPPLK